MLAEVSPSDENKNHTIYRVLNARASMGICTYLGMRFCEIQDLVPLLHQAGRCTC
jgi:hypothetical protein